MPDNCGMRRVTAHVQISMNLLLDKKSIRNVKTRVYERRRVNSQGGKEV